MADFSDDEVIRGSALRSDPVLADVKFLRREYARLVETTEEHSEKIDSMAAMLRELQQTLSQLNNQLGISPIDAESSQQALPEQRVEQKKKRMETTSLNLQESISSIATVREMITVVEEPSEIVAGNLDERASEKKSITQNQVPVSSLEPSLSFSSEPVDVSASWPCAFVSNNPVHSQSGFESVKNLNNAHLVFGELHLRRHKFQQRKKPSLSPKSRMFKFKNRTLLSNWSQMDLHQVIDISNVTNSYHCLSADFGLVRKKRTFQCLRLRNLRLHKQAHMSRFLNPLRMLHDPGGMNQLLHGDMKSWFVCDRESGKRFRDMAVQPKRQVGLDKIELQLDQRDITLVGLQVEIASLLEVICVGTECMMHSTTVISAKLLENGLLVFPWNLMLVAIVLFIHLEDKVCLSGASNSWCDWLVFDRGKNNIISGDVITVVFLDLKKCFFQGAEKRDVQMMLLVKAKDAHVDNLISSMLPLYVYQMVVSDIQDNDKEMVADPVTQAVRNLVTNAARFGFITVLSQTHAVHLDVHLEFSETSASTSLYGYCLPSTRSWPYHRKILIREIVGYGADVQIGHFEDFLAPELKKHRYECCYMKRNKKTYEVDYNKSAQALIDASNSKPFASERLIKDNIVLIAVLEAKFGDPSGKLICVANTRFDVQTDLKVVMLWQVHTLSNGLEVKSSSIWHRWRRKPLFLLHFWKKNCWYQRLFLLSGLMMTGHREFLVQWQQRDSDTSWMLSQDFASLYSALKLEDKLVFRGESIDTSQGLDDVATA